MKKTNKLPQKKVQLINRYGFQHGPNARPDTDTTSSSITTISGTHTFIK